VLDKLRTGLVVLILVVTSAGVAGADQIMVDLTATAQELGGQEHDRFTLDFQSNEPDLRISCVVYDLTGAADNLFFDIIGPDSFDFATMTGNQPVVDNHASVDNSPFLLINFGSFQPGEMLVFGVDVDGIDCSVFTPQGFAGSRVAVIFDLTLIDPEAEPYALMLTFEEGSDSVGTGGMVPIPEPATVCSLCGVAGLLHWLRRRRVSRRTRT